MKTIEEIESIIEEACQAAIKRGFKIKPKATLTMEQCCPLGAVSLTCARDEIASFNHVFKVLQIDAHWADDFIDGYDASPGLWDGLEISAYATLLGMKFRKRYP